MVIRKTHSLFHISIFVLIHLNYQYHKAIFQIITILMTKLNLVYFPILFLVKYCSYCLPSIEPFRIIIKKEQ